MNLFIKEPRSKIKKKKKIFFLGGGGGGWGGGGEGARVSEFFYKESKFKFFLRFCFFVFFVFCRGGGIVGVVGKGVARVSYFF